MLNQLSALGETQDALDMGGETVTLQQLLGIEINDRAATLAELVLWIGFLQWHIRTIGRAGVAEPVVHDYGNIEHRDAVLAYDRQEPVTDAHGQLVSCWDGHTTKAHAVTGEQVPDEAAQVVQWRYINPRQANWPAAEFIVGNPPFIGNKRMRVALGDGYADALRAAWPEVPESADFVMYWWHKAAETVRTGRAKRFGLITTNSLTMIFNRRVIEAHQTATPPLSLAFAVPDHPWVDGANGAAVRIAMSVGLRGTAEGKLQTVTQEVEAENGEVAVELATRQGFIYSDLKVGANVAGAKRLQCNLGMSFMGVILVGKGFVLGQGQPLIAKEPGAIRPYLNGRDLTQTPRGAFVIDLYGLSREEAMAKFPNAYQHLLDTVKPERDQVQRAAHRTNWWLFGEKRPAMRAALKALPRYIGTTETAKHRTFSFIDSKYLPDQKIRVVAHSDAFFLGVLSSAVHLHWALAAGGTLEDRPVYNNTTCFEAFPFPDIDPAVALAERIRTLAEQMDAHRKAQLAAHADATLTATYNVLEKLRSGEPLTAKEKVIHAHGLVGVLKSLHDELDAAVLQAYGWADLNLPADTDTLLQRLVALNTQRSVEEAAGTVRWLRPAFQQSRGEQVAFAADDTAAETEVGDDAVAPGPAAPVVARAWPSGLPEQIKAVAEVLSQARRSLDLEELAAHFQGRGRWRERLPTLLNTLLALGRLRQTAAGRWVDAGR